MRGVAVLRPQPGASITVERARKRGLDALAIPLFQIEPVDWKAPEASSFDALLITSANALRCGGEQLHGLRGLPVHAVGQATADAAREAGFDVASTGDAGVARLLGSLRPELKLLHLCGEHRRTANSARQSITPVATYRAKEIPADLRPATGTVALIHSPRAGARFGQLIDEAGIDRKFIAIAAISKAAADSAGEGWQAVEAAENPDEDALLALAARLCNKPDGQ
jgi:uroporphyrinogen-III synthase